MRLVSGEGGIVCYDEGVSDPPAHAAPLHRRLAAVLVMDTAGYSRLMEADVEGTHRRLSATMSRIVVPALTGEDGRIVKGTGDGALVEFPSVSQAVRASLRIQQENNAAEEDRPIDRRIRFRIGINLADVIVEANDIFGDGVNIAARLEGIGQPGDIIVSETAMQTADRAGLRFVDLGPQRLKNISRPVRAFRVLLDGPDAPAEEADAGLVPGFGARPAIGVLPFLPAVVGDPQQEAFADGLTEEVISALARWRAFPVISRNAMFAFKGRAADARMVGREVGARYIEEGRIRRDATRGRINVELIECETSAALSGEQFEFDSGDAFSLQDDIARSIVGALEPELLRHERDRAARALPQNASAYECYQRAMWHHYRYKREDSEQACVWFRRALDADPNYAHATAGLAICLANAAASRWVGNPKVTLAEALAIARVAAQTDPRDPMAHFAVGTLSHWNGLLDEAMVELQEAVRLDPSHAAAHANIAFVYNYMNRPEDARPEIELALRLSRHDPRRFIFLPALSISHYLAGRYKEALAVAQEALSLRSDYPVAIRYLLASLGQLGLRVHGAPLVTLMRRLDGGLAQTEALMRTTFLDAAVRHIADGLRKAGYT